MRKNSVLVLMAAAVAIVGSSTVVLAGGPPTSADAYTCVKVKTLKDPAFAATVGATSNVHDGSVLGQAGGCTNIVKKLKLLCLPSDVGTDIAVSTGTAQCCFKTKCTALLATATPLVLSTNAGGSMTALAGQVDIKKAALTCAPCNFSLAP